METKRKIYILAFTVLGLLIGFLVKSLVEIVYIKLLVMDFITYSFGLSWSELIQFHFLFSAILIAVCGLWGYAAGRFWWKQIYVLKKLNHRHWLGFVR